MKDSRSQNHFENTKKPHTKIKHFIFEEILRKSLSIANNCSSTNKNASYTYIDLFAGNGIFKDQSRGSPLIALDIFISHTKSNNYFNSLKLIAIDKDKSNIDNVEKLISEKLFSFENKNIIKHQTYTGDWSCFTNNIKKSLASSNWGFVFADPFSTELNIDTLKETLKGYFHLKDILVFFNYNTLARQNGRMCDTDIERLCKALGLSEDELFDKKQFSDKFENSIKKHFLGIKKFVKGVAFPVTKEGSLIKGDYFYLIFATNSLMLINDFLVGYETILKKISGYREKIQIYDELHIINYIEDNGNKTSLLELYNYLTDRFLSWKYTVSQGTPIPTLKKVIETINSLYNKKYILIECDSGYLYKERKGAPIGNIKHSSINKGEHLSQIFLSIKT